MTANAAATGLVLIGLTIGAARAASGEQGQTALIRLCFLIHPMCYRGRGPELIAGGMAPDAFAAYSKVEDQVAPRWWRAIETMEPTGTLVILPHGDTEAERELHKFAEQTLGPRCLILRRGMPWDGAFWEGLGPDFTLQLGEELRQALLGQAALSTWDAQVSVATMAYAHDIREALRERGFTFDPATIRAEAWGESFEGCVFVYSVRLRAYLGLASPVEDRFDMTVPDALFLTNARLLDSLALPGDVRLYLWEGADARPIGAFFETSQPLRSPRRFVDLKAASLKLDVTDKNGNPVQTTPIEGGIRVPLQETFLFGEPGSADALRSALAQARIE